MAKITVMEYERVVRLVDGRVQDVLGPGRHSYRRRRTKLHKVDIRPYLLNVPGQEVLTSDGVAVKVSATARVAVSDPVAVLTVTQNAQAEVYTAIQHALRTAIAAVSVDDLVSTRVELPAEIADSVRAAGARVGLSVDDLGIRDLMLAGDLRRAYNDVVLARQAAKAQLEKARSEAAALRSLANTADLLEKHPALLKLRTLQAADGGQIKLVVKSDT